MHVIIVVRHLQSLKGQKLGHLLTHDELVFSHTYNQQTPKLIIKILLRRDPNYPALKFIKLTLSY